MKTNFRPLILLLTAASSLHSQVVTLTTPPQANYTFHGDTTYYINSKFPITLSGTTTFEAGAVIKYAPAASLTVSVINWQ
jgi:hypothetical protein